MGELRSALELALQKAERLGPLSPEERLRQQAQRWKDAADAFVRPYLEGVGDADLDSLPEAASSEERRERAAAVARSLLELLAGPFRIEEQMLPRIEALAENTRPFAPAEAAAVVRASSVSSMAWLWTSCVSAGWVAAPYCARTPGPCRNGKSGQRSLSRSTGQP
jgi:hypothetical protein